HDELGTLERDRLALVDRIQPDLDRPVARVEDYVLRPRLVLQGTLDRDALLDGVVGLDLIFDLVVRGNLEPVRLGPVVDLARLGVGRGDRLGSGQLTVQAGRYM